MNSIKKNFRENTYLGFLILFVGLFIVNLFFGIRVDTDDNWFKGIHTVYPDVFKFLKWRYDSYSARIIPDGIDYFIFNVPIIIWQVLNSLFIFLGGYLLAKLFNNRVTFKSVGVAITSLCLADFSLIWDSAYWVTGSLNYLWPAVAALFILKPYFMRYQQQDQNEKWWYQLLMLIATIYVGLSNEQILALLLGFILLFEGYNLIKNHCIKFISIPIIIILFTIIVFLLKSPGLAARQAHEISFWTPEFNKYSTNLKIRIWYVWAIRNIAKLYYFVPLLLTGLMYVVLNQKKKQEFFFTIQLWLLPITMLSSLSIDFNRIFIYLYQPVPMALANHDFWIAILPYILWSFELLVLSAGVVLSKQNKVMVLFFLLSIVAGLAIVGNSPAIFSTVKIYRGARIFFFIDFYIAIFALDLLKNVENSKILKVLYSVAIGGVLLGVVMY